MPSYPFRRLIRGCVVAALALPAVTAAQTASAPALKAAFLFNFVKFTDWPDGALSADAPLVMCVGDDAVAEALTAVVAGRTVGTRAVEVVRVAIDPYPLQRPCALLYLTGLDARRTTRMLGALADTSVLSVSDSAEFTRLGGVMDLFVEDGQMRFAINVTAAERARLRLSSQLLSLARIVRD